MKKNLKFQFSIAFVCLVMGFVLIIQLQTMTKGIGPVSEWRARELSVQLKKLTEDKDNLLKLKSELETKISAYENAAAGGDKASLLLKEELDNVRLLAGLTDVEGPGINVSIDDGNVSAELDYALISHEMLLLVVNELNAAGAEAISINGQRMISETEIRQAGVHININTVQLAPPYVLKVIGDPKQLDAALQLRGGIKDQFQETGVKVSITKSELIMVEKYNGIIEHLYAIEVKKAEQ